jgi:anti-sigma factor RsiW
MDGRLEHLSRQMQEQFTATNTSVAALSSRLDTSVAALSQRFDTSVAAMNQRLETIITLLTGGTGPKSPEQ